MSKPIQHIRLLALLLTAASLTFSFTSCVKVDTSPILEVLVLDQFNNPVQEAGVGIFDDMDEWGYLENPVQVWKTTDVNGRVVITDLREINYFIYVEKGDLNNLKNEVSTETPLVTNTKRQIVIHID